LIKIDETANKKVASSESDDWTKEDNKNIGADSMTSCERSSNRCQRFESRAKVKKKSVWSEVEKSGLYASPLKGPGAKQSTSIARAWQVLW